MSSVKEFVNCIHVSKSYSVCMKLDADDPGYSKEWLHVKLKSPTINVKQLTKKFSSFGPVDIMPLAQKRVLMAYSNKNSALRILKQFHSSKEFQVARYNHIRHGAASTIYLWSGIALTSGLLIWAIKKTFLRSVINEPLIFCRLCILHRFSDLSIHINCMEIRSFIK